MTYKEFFFYGNLLQVHPEAKKNGKWMLTFPNKAGLEI
jgi:hypothetical protein